MPKNFFFNNTIIINIKPTTKTPDGQGEWLTGTDTVRLQRQPGSGTGTTVGSLPDPDPHFRYGSGPGIKTIKKYTRTDFITKKKLPPRRQLVKFFQKKTIENPGAGSGF